MTDNKLAVFGERDDIKEIAERLQKMMPGTTNFTQQEALTVAQIAVSHGLDPFTGEVWGLKGANGKWYGCMIGIAGRRKISKRQAEKEGGVYWTEPPSLVSPETYNAPSDAVVYEITLRDTVTTQAYAKSLNSLTTAGIPYQDALKMLGTAPKWVGVGIATPDEQSKMGIHARAKKRAEADALKQRFDVELVGIQYEEGRTLPSGDVIDGIIIEDHEVIRSGKTEDQLLKELGFGPDPRDNSDKIKKYHTLIEEGHQIGLVDDPTAPPPSDPEQLEAVLYDLEFAIKEYKQTHQEKLL